MLLKMTWWGLMPLQVTWCWLSPRGATATVVAQLHTGKQFTGKPDSRPGTIFLGYITVKNNAKTIVISDSCLNPCFLY
jgi:hypothetical protein